MAGLNTFDNRSTERIANTVRSYEKEVIRTKDQPKRRRSTANGGVEQAHPFKVSTGNDSVIISSGSIIVYDGNGGLQNNYFIPEEEVDVTNLSGDLYLYLKIPQSNTDVNGFREFPLLTVGTVNFAINNQVFPQTDIEKYYLPIATLSITEENDVKTIAINQVTFENGVINGSNIHAFRLVLMRSAKGSDVQPDTTYDYYLGSGVIIHPEGVSDLDFINGTTPISSNGIFYLNLEYDENTNGYKENYNPALEYLPSETTYPPSTSANYVFPLASFSDGSVAQVQFETIRSDGQIW